MHTVLYLQSEGLLRFIIDKGADIHTSDAKGRNSLWIATIKGCEVCAKVLLEKGVDKSQKGEDYYSNKMLTPLQVAKANKYDNIVELLKD